MALAFPLTPRVKAGDLPTAEQMVALANRANIQEESGLGDGHWRTVQLAINWSRQFRTSDELGSTPAQGEYPEFYSTLDPVNDIGLAPVAGPGEPEGANVVSPVNAWEFGIDAAGFAGEEGRISDPAVLLWQRIDGPPRDLEEWWELGKAQRGVMDPNSGEQNVPAIAAARSAQFLAYNTRSPYNKSTGGFFPTPVELLAICGTNEATGDGIPSYEIKFTALKDDVAMPANHGTVSTVGSRSVITYAGSCPDWTDDAADGHVQDIVLGSGYYIVFVLEGGVTTFDILPRADWIQGPYSGEGKLTRYNADLFSWAVWVFANGFRGTEAQRNPDTFDIEKIAFSFEEFRANQYHLAPNIGYDTGFGIEASYPHAEVSGNSIPAGTILPFNGSGESHSYTDGFVLSGMFVKATKLQNTIVLEVLSGDDATPIETIILGPDQPMVLQTLQRAVKPAPLRVRLMNEAKFDGTGTIVFEANELLEYKPDQDGGAWDAYLLLRLSATRGGAEGEGTFLDGAGVDETGATEIYKNYLRYGCIVNTRAAGIRSIENAANPNPVYDAMRRFLNDLMRVVNRRAFLSYETNAEGLPVLRFKRYALGAIHQRGDLFAGIAPSYRAVVDVLEGIEYVVRADTGGTVEYQGTSFKHNDRFIGVKDAKEYSAQGDAIVLEYEGIRTEAPPQGWSNEWLMSEETWFYHPSDTSLWKLDGYADWYVRNNRCHTYAYALPTYLARVADLPSYPASGADYRLHLSPEAPSGYNFAIGANAAGVTDDFCRSCQVYKPPYKVKSATVEFSADGNDIVTLVFAAPFQRDAGAPASIARDALTWSDAEIAALRAEPYRTTDNALREYMLLIAKGINGSWKIGDAAAQSFVQDLPDNPFGSIIPRFFFTSEAKKPCTRTPGVWDPSDTRISIDEFMKLVFKLKAWCEGCVDAETTVSLLCGGLTKPFDFTFEDLKFQAFGAENIGGGFGPLVNTALRAETYNQIGACFDLLNKFRLDGIMKLESREKIYSAFVDVTVGWGSAVCPPTSSGQIWYDGSAPEPSLDSTSGWGANGLTASVGAGIAMCGPSGSGGTIAGMIVNKTDIEWRSAPNAAFQYAITPTVQELLDNFNFGMVAIQSGFTTIDEKHDTAEISESQSCGGFPNAFFDLTLMQGWYWTERTTDDPDECVFTTGGKLEAGSPQGSTFAVCTRPIAGTVQEVGIAGGFRQKSLTVLSDAAIGILVVPLVEEAVA